ncbi:hypothetical protein QC762_0024580 [Podospora pseudocomata]|uniref:Uncharacterized protein n=1 Tax=Podospora pseudocomata TaxID=2093779 RepID=A0ABR0GYV8_9PEZI|nr:hypothetical protein QC762_0024580 [Podospora pseudocomata]
MPFHSKSLVHALTTAVAAPGQQTGLGRLPSGLGVGQTQNGHDVLIQVGRHIASSREQTRRHPTFR